MARSHDQQSVEDFVSAICGGDFAEKLAQAFAANQVPIDSPRLSVILENRSALRLSSVEYGLFETAQHHHVMLKSFARLIRQCERLGAVLVEAGCVPSDEVLEQLKQTETSRRQKASH